MLEWILLFAAGIVVYGVILTIALQMLVYFTIDLGVGH